MGTSSARRSPATPKWRFAKAAATRYLAPEGTAPVEAREVVRHYLAAVEDSAASQGGDFLAGFRLTRKAAQKLGEFGDRLAAAGWAAAAGAWGIPAAGLPPESVISALASLWVEENGGLEAAVARSALAACLGKFFPPEPDRPFPGDGPFLVRVFLALALFQRLVLDLGESLEAAAPGWPAFSRALVRLEEECLAAAATPAFPPPPEKWDGLAGWLYVTKTLEVLCQVFKGSGPGP